MSPNTVHVGFFSTPLGMTERLVNKLYNVTPVRILPSLAEETPRVPPGSMVAIPTYHDGSGAAPIILPAIERFLDYNKSNLVGIIGVGNRSFGNTFCLSARMASKLYRVPIVELVELAGTPEELAVVQKAIELTRR